MLLTVIILTINFSELLEVICVISDNVCQLPVLLTKKQLLLSDWGNGFSSETHF